MNDMLFCCFAVFLLMSTAAFFFLRLDYALWDSIHAKAKQRAKSSSFRERSKLKQKLDKTLVRCAALISGSQMPHWAYFLLTLFCSAVGYLAGRIVFRSFPVSLAVGTLGLIAPLLIFSFRQTKAKTADLERLASTMMILSNSYVVTEDFIASVRDNLTILEYPEPFRYFLTYVTMMDASVAVGLRRLESQVRNDYFSQWIDALVLAQEDRSLKYVAVSVVDSMHDVLAVQAESDAAMYAVWRDYLLTLVMIFSVPLIFRFSLPEAYVTMTESVVGQGLFILLLGAVVYSVLRAMRLNKPLML